MTAKTKEAIRQVLKEWGFPIVKETDQSVLFRYQMSYIQASITSGDNASAVAMTLSGLHATDPEDLILTLRTCNFLNHHMLQVKLYIDEENDLIIASEYFYKEGEDMEFQMNMALQTVTTAKRRFLEKYRELNEEAHILSQLDEE